MLLLTLPKKFSPVLGLILSVSGGVFGQTPKTEEARELPPGQTIEGQMTGAETHRYRISLKQDEFFQVRVEQKGVDVALKLADAHDQTLATMDSPNGTEGFEVLSFVATRADSFLLEVSGFDAKAIKGNYTIRREASRMATAIDRKRVAVERLFVEGITARDAGGQRETAITKLGEALGGWQDLKDNYLIELTAQAVKQEKASAKYDEATAFIKQGTKESLETSITRFGEARQLYSELGDQRSEAHVLNELGNIYGLLGENQKALEQFTLSLPLKRSIGDKAGEATTLNNIGAVHNRLGDNQKALDYYHQALPLIKLGDDRSAEAKLLNNIGKVYADTSENQKALDYYNQSLLISSEIKDLSGEATSLNNIGKVNADLGENQKALDYYNQSLPLIRALRSTLREAVVLNNIGLVYSALGENQKALDYFNQSLPLSKSVGDKEGEAATLGNIGAVHHTLGEQQKALDYYSQSLLLIRAAANKRSEGAILNSIGNVYEDLGEHQKAMECYDQALVLKRTVGNRDGEAGTLNDIGAVYNHLGEKQKALEYFKLALSLYETVGDKNGAATTLNNLGGVYSDLGEKQKALDYYTQSLPLSQAVGNRIGEARTLNNIGGVYIDLDDRQKALEYYNKSLSLKMAVGDRRGEAATRNNIGLVYSDLGDYLQGLKYYNQALLLSRAVRDRDGEANILGNIGTTYAHLGDKQKTLDYLNQALPLRKAVGDRRGEAITLNNLMNVWSWFNNQRLAILYGKQAVNNFQSLRADIKGLDKELQQSFLGTVEDTYRLLAELLIKENRIPEAERVLRMLKEEEYFEFVRHDGLVVASLDERINLNPAEKQAVGQYETAASEITRLYHEIERFENEKPSSSAAQSIISVRQAELNKELEVASSKLERVLVDLSRDFAIKDTDSKSVEESSQAIVKEWNDPQTAVISTIVGGKNLSLIVTTAEFQRGYVIAISDDKLNKLVGDFRTAIIERSDPEPAAQELYNVLLKPLEKDLELARAKTLIWSLDKFLRYVPVAALWDKDRGYVVQNYGSVVLALASRQNLAFRPTNKDQWQALGVGVSKRAEGFDALSYVPKELEAIIQDSSVQPKQRERGMIAGRRLLDEQFTYDSLLKSLGNYQFAHAATHFKFIPGTKAEGLNSFLLLGNGEKLTLSQVQNSNNIFAGIELLTLSACDTGYGGKTADGREIEGFGVLAQRKGARAIMATLWPVDSESTRDFMVEFYGAYKKPNLNKAEALRQAQLALLGEPDKAMNSKTSNSRKPSSSEFSHPFYWSPFILIGNWQ